MHEAEVVVQRDGDRQRVVVAVQPERAAHVLVVSVQVGDDVAARLVAEQSQAILETRGLASPLGEHVVDRQITPGRDLRRAPRRATDVVDSREPLRIQVGGEADHVGEHIAHAPCRGRRYERAQLRLIERADGRHEPSTYGVVHLAGVDRGSSHAHVGRPIRCTISRRMSSEVAKFSRAKPWPSLPKLGPSLSRTPRWRNCTDGSSPQPNARQSSHAR